MVPCTIRLVKCAQYSRAQEVLENAHWSRFASDRGVADKATLMLGTWTRCVGLTAEEPASLESHNCRPPEKQLSQVISVLASLYFQRLRSSKA